ncbi:MULTISPECIES: hypothetical protein [Vibrio]|uniref:hypothetical protein n=1 Tax=Vibrio TaxID=662 RepID=UPI000B8E7441|nr:MULTISPECIES: hypothetical protein [Vibrio]MBF4290194.1 hypothetical protein [Vibrio anguillarum]MBF4358916.1 hypothetical protein [Vibrio anguillarum]OXX44653.1 hypothetical protein B9J93_13000 [Vibrio sp. V17_P4S1T151]OXX59527.1 hypothetical protein B9J89_21340 [Vibrio sp. V15_P4S5T153]OXX69615.1 hypothetical protein B9J94_05540 [Vibrio sp. V20_P4S3T152]
MSDLCRFNFETFAYNVDSNLSSMGLPVMDSAFGAATSSIAAYSALDHALHFGGKPPANIAVGLSVFYAGAVLGSAVMAANRATRCDKKQLIQAAKQLGLYGGWIDEAVNNFPQILRSN